jgi:hypothetical protein
VCGPMSCSAAAACSACASLFTSSPVKHSASNWFGVSMLARGTRLAVYAATSSWETYSLPSSPKTGSHTATHDRKEGLGFRVP